MTDDDAAALLRPAVHPVGGAWADLGAGTGMFTRALAVLNGPHGSVIAVDRDAGAVQALAQLSKSSRAASTMHARIDVVEGDFTETLPLHDLDGIVVANALHFVPSTMQRTLLVQFANYLQPTGRIVVVEYDRDVANRWVPFPLPRARLVTIAEDALHATPVFVASQPSKFGGDVYCAVILRSDRETTG